MPLAPPQLVAVAHRSRADGHALVQAHPIADLGRLAHHHARPVIDEEPPADGRSGMDVDPGPVMGVLGHDPRQQRHPEGVQLVSDPEDGERPNRGVGHDDLVEAARRRIAGIGGLDVLGEHATHRGHALEHLPRHGLGRASLGQRNLPEQRLEALGERRHLGAQRRSVALEQHQSLGPYGPVDHLVGIEQPPAGRLGQRIVVTFCERLDGVVEALVLVMRQIVQIGSHGHLEAGGRVPSNVACTG